MIGWRRRRDGRWLEAHGHDVSLLPGGVVLHHDTCWCTSKRADTRARGRRRML